jgi:hypothetical protein
MKYLTRFGLSWQFSATNLCMRFILQAGMRLSKALEQSGDASTGTKVPVLQSGTYRGLTLDNLVGSTEIARVSAGLATCQNLCP